MRAFSDDFLDTLNTPATTLCFCWRLFPKNRPPLGFTDHDEDLIFEQIIHLAHTGLDVSEMQSNQGFSINNAEISGALSADILREDDLLAGVFDSARLETWVVNWCDVTQRTLLRTGRLGDITLEGQVFRAEVRGNAHALGIVQGRIFQKQCDALLGDERCQCDLSRFQTSVCLSEILSPCTYVISGADHIAQGQLTHGTAQWQSGKNKGLSLPIQSHTLSLDGKTKMTLWDSPPWPATEQETILVTAGCDKTLETCLNVFENVVHFRGFPFIPGYDALFRIPKK